MKLILFLILLLVAPALAEEHLDVVYDLNMTVKEAAFYLATHDQNITYVDHEFYLNGTLLEEVMFI
jgi:hypothetical protein